MSTERRALPRISLRGRDLQVIVKLASIVLSPSKPSYPGGTWHVEGMRDEAIVATAIYYLANDNVADTRLRFRQSVSEPTYEQDDRSGVECAYGLVDQEPLVQDLGHGRVDLSLLRAGILVENHRCHGLVDRPQR